MSMTAMLCCAKIGLDPELGRVAEQMQQVRDGGPVQTPKTRSDRWRLLDASTAFPYLVPVAGHIYRVPPHPLERGLEGALLIVDDITVLIDTGFSYQQALELSEYVDVVITSHPHLGHTGKNYLFKEIWALHDEAHIVEDFEKQLAYHGGVGTPVEVFWRKWMERLKSDRGSEVARTFVPGEVLDFGRTRWQVLLVPGHCPGHCCFYEPNLGLLYSADITLNSFGPFYGSPNSDLRAFQDSLMGLMKLDMKVIATSAKGPFFSEIKERLATFHDHFEQRNNRLVALLREPSSLDDLANGLPVHGRAGDPSEIDYVRFGERNMVEKHLELLVAEGRVKREGDLYRAV